MSVFGVTRSEMERAIERECSNRAKELEATVNSIGKRVENLESDAKHITEHEAKIDKLEKQFKELDEKLDKKFTNIDDKFDNLDKKFTEVIQTTRKHVDEQVDRAINKLSEADDRWRDTNTKLQLGMDSLNEKMGELVTTVKDLGNRTSELEDAPAKRALERENTAKKAFATKAFDILWKVFLAGIAALLAAKGINLF